MGAAFVQVSSHRDAPAPPPETWDAYSKKSEETTGVISMIDLLVKDLEKEMTEAETEEKEAQADYETMMKEKELMAVLKYISSLHSECDWLLQYFDVRKEARAGEIGSLVKAKAVLSGADFSLVQTKARSFLAKTV